MGAPSPSTSKRDVKKLLAAAQQGDARPERTVKICMKQSLQAVWEDVERQIIDLETHQREAGAGSLAGNPEAEELATRQVRLREQMLEHTLTFRLVGLPRRKFRALVALHPPREGNKADALLGFNQDDLVEDLIKASTVEPELDEDDWQVLLEEILTDGTYEVLTNAAWAVNRHDTSVPFSRAASQILRISEPT